MIVVQAEASSPIILAEHLSKVYAAGRIMVAAVRDVSFAVKRGEFVAIVGPSGSGKSTLFYLLGGLTKASEGKVVIDGIDFASLSDAETDKTAQEPYRLRFPEIQPAADAFGDGQYRNRLHRERAQGADGPQVPGAPDATCCRFAGGCIIGLRS